MRLTTVRRLAPALSALVLATVSVTAASAGGAAPKAVSEFCSQADLAFDASILGASRSDLKAAREKLDSILEAKPPRKVTKALKRIKKSIAGADLEPSAKVIAAVTGAAAVVASYVARECGEPGGPAGTGASNARCPWTAEQVSAVLGATVEEAAPGACQFFPPNDISPTALYVRQIPLICQGDSAAEVGYTEPVDGFDEKAYLGQDGSGAQILVCTDPPIEVSAEIPGDEAASLAAAKELAELAVD